MTKFFSTPQDVQTTELIRTSQSWDGVEMVGTIHHGENRGTKSVILYMFYLSQEGIPLSVQHPEIPL